jgi:hypothetical protein
LKFGISIILLSILVSFFVKDLYSSLAIGLTLSIVLIIILKSTESFMFREWALLLYAVNYLLAPAITYQMDSSKVTYAMKLTSNEYFSLAFPGYVLFSLGMMMISTRIFKPDFSEISKTTLINEVFLVKLTLFGILCNLVSGVFSTDFAFFIYLLSLVRFVGVFALFASNSIKYRWLIFCVLGFEIYVGFRNALFHDAIMWLIFYGLFHLYVNKPNLTLRIIGSLSLIIFVLLIQAFKSDYRERVWFGGEAASFETIGDVGFNNANFEDIAGENNLLGTLNRGNQAWIFASTVDNINRTKDFQGMKNVNLYFEAALLPRFLAPNKITAGNRLIFNKFSGHELEVGTSMGLGVFADGYIAYGQIGVYLFTFVLGLFFSLTFKLVEMWSKISPFYVLLTLPILNYAIRPDCELQTTINHISKSIVVFGLLVYLTKYRFTMDSTKVNK